MTSVQTKVDMAVNYMNYLSCELTVQEFRHFYSEVFRRVGTTVKMMGLEVVAKETSNDRQGTEVSPDAGGTG